MKKFLFFLMAATMFAGAVHAKHNCGCEGCDCKVEHKLQQKQKNKGGFLEKEITPISVARASTLEDGTKVMLIGRIVSQIGGHEYNFTDGTDHMVVEIGRKTWKGVVVSPNDKVILKGKIEKDDDRTVLDVKSVKMVN